MKGDEKTAKAFADSWNNLPEGSVYTREQAEDWFAPLTPADFAGKMVLELGCGNGSLLLHVAEWGPQSLEGIDLGDSVLSAELNVERSGWNNCKIIRADLTSFARGGYDIVYCIGVLHHLLEPEKGFASVVRNTREGGRFHCWVYAKEGNLPVRLLVEPIRRIASRLPWWLTKYGIALPLAVPFYWFAKTVAFLRFAPMIERLPLFRYCLWISRRDFSFFRHVAFDQLITPQTAYIEKGTIEKWLASHPRIDPKSVYIIFRNGNSWKFGGKLSSSLPAG